MIEEREKIFFLNLGGYKPGEFEEYHYKVLAVSKEKSFAIQEAKETVFYKHTLSSHIDDKYGVDVDDVYEVEDILPLHLKEKYAIQILPTLDERVDELHIGYFKLSKL